MPEQWHEQVKLLLAVLPEVGRESSFALHGGTAINLFVRDMPRLSVDIDLTFARIADRQTSLPFTYEDFEKTRVSLIRDVQAALTPSDRAFLLSVDRLEPGWDGYPFTDFPAVRWKLHNLEKFRRSRPQDWAGQVEKLEQVLYG